MSTQEQAHNAAPMPETLLAAGTEHETAGRWEAARHCYQKAVQIAPDNGDANHRLGVLVARLDGFAASLPFLRAAVKAAPDKGRHWLVLSEALLKAGKPDEALAIIETAIARGLKASAAQTLQARSRAALEAAAAAPRGRGPEPAARTPRPKATAQPSELAALQALFRAGRFGEAAEAASKLCRRKPQEVAAWKIAGASLHALGRLTEACELFRRGAQANPRDAELSYNLGNLLREQEQTEAAVAAYRQALATDPRLLPAYLNLGGLLGQLNRLDEAEATYRQALACDPRDADAQDGLGHVLARQGRHAEAVQAFGQAVRLRPDFADAEINLGTALRALGRLKDAEDAYRRALALAPTSAPACNNLGVLTQGQGRLGEAEAAFRKAVTLNPGFLAATLNLGTLLRDTHRGREAGRAYRRALVLAPDDPDATLNLGNLLREAGRLREAEALYRDALAKHPNNPAYLNNLGITLQALGHDEAAESAFRQALEADPGFIDAQTNLLDTLEHSNRLEALRDQIARARQTCGDHPALTLAAARLLDRDGEPQQARDSLEALDPAVLPQQMQAARLAFLGDLCDRLNDTDAAFASFSQHNQLAAHRAQQQGIDKTRFLARIDACAARFTGDWIATWTTLTTRPERPAPVFLIGFPRSGTTLLDTLLRGHPQIAVVEEKPAISRLRAALASLPGGDPDGLATLDDAQAAHLRQAYFQELDRHLDSDGAVQIDKLPLNAVEVGLLQRVFPDARFLLALRHPCDCVLSCFMHAFRLNDAMANFLTLEDSAHLYDKVMGLLEHYRGTLSLSLHTVRYEALVTDVRATLEPLLAFLGVSWSEAVLDHIATARRRGRIHTPSYNQVTQPLYHRAAGRWTRYGEVMAPVLPILQPWIKRYGYEAAPSDA